MSKKRADTATIGKGRMDVTDIHTERSITPDPPLDQKWDDLTKLLWHAGVVHHRSGLDVTVEDNVSLSEWRFGAWRLVSNMYTVRYGGPSSGHTLTFHQAWWYMNGLQDGHVAVPR